MITLEALAAYGADTKAGLARCMNNEGFYLRLVNMELADENFIRLREAMEAGDARAAFEAAHALKGAVGNLALTPIYDPVSRLTELLRSADTVSDPEGLLSAVLKACEELKALAE